MNENVNDFAGMACSAFCAPELRYLWSDICISAPDEQLLLTVCIKAMAAIVGQT
jgi:hypothetical protein